MKTLAAGIVAGIVLTLAARHLLIRYSNHGLPSPDYMGVKFSRSVNGVRVAWGIA